MGLGDIEKFIKEIDVKNIRISPKVKDKLLDRNLSTETILQHLKENQYDGIIKQDKDEYIIIIKLDALHDLVIILRKDRGYINIKTSFLQDKKRRFREGWR